MGDTPTVTVGMEDRDLQSPFAVNYSPNLIDHFPFPTIRPAQTKALDTFNQAVKQNKKFIVLELPCGVGKSPLAIDIGSWAKTLPESNNIEPGSYILTPQKSLQDQYLREFEPRGLACLKGKSNYTCNGFHYPEEEGGEAMDCETAEDFYGEEHKENCTGYKPTKAQFINTPLGTTNFSYYLGEVNYAGQLPDRKVLILDESHNTEQQILALASVEINRYRCEEAGVKFEDVPYLNPDRPDPSTGTGEALDWLNEVFVPAALKYIAEEKSEAQDLQDQHGMKKEAAKHMRKARGMDRFLQSLNLFLTSENRTDWAVWSEPATEMCPNCRAKLRPGTKACWRRDCKALIPERPAKLIIRPLTAAMFADKLLFSHAEKVVFMSATILAFNPFLKALGINRDEAVCLSVPSEFPVENRRVYVKKWQKGHGSMSFRCIDHTLPEMAQEVEHIMRKHAHDKGIVHCVSFKVAKYLIDYLTRCGLGDRIITHTSEEKGSRDKAVEEHIASTKASVLFSPSMQEGLDLKEELSRFQIIAKVPYQPLTPYVRARMARDPLWYTYTAALALMQATGRSVRSMTDWAVTYILDGDFESFVKRAGAIIPDWWSEAVEFMREWPEEIRPSWVISQSFVSNNLPSATV